MNPQKKIRLLKATRYWLASFAIAAGLFYYKSASPLGPVLIAGFVTFLLTVGRAYYQQNDL